MTLRHALSASVFVLFSMFSVRPLLADDGSKQVAGSVSTFRSWARSHGLPAAAFVVMAHGKTVASAGYGGWTPTQPEHLASLSKAITGVCIAHLAEDGHLKFSDTLGTLLAGTMQRLGQPVDARFGSITVEQLLQHRSGLARNTWPWWVDGTETLEQRFTSVLKTPLAANPGTVRRYSNIGYLTLGIVIQALTGQDYETVCRREAIDPMGVHGTIDPKLKQRAPEGGWLMSAADYARFVQVVQPGNPILNTSSLDWLQAQAGAYGMGAMAEPG